MSNGARWPRMLIVLVLTLCLVGLIAYGRGPKHHHGDEVGTHGTKIVVVRPG
jgi:hypothetical protein